MSIDTRLATYGSLAPGRPNHDQLFNLTGHWQKAWVRGRLVQDGWGAAIGYPALVLDPEGEAIEVSLFTSRDLLTSWERLDAFEGAGYRRARVEAKIGDATVEAWIYVSAST